MAWFVGRSLVVIVSAFGLGVVVGWLWWQRRPVRFTESDAVAAVTTRHKAELRKQQALLHRRDAALQAKDAEIALLTARLEAAAPASPDELPIEPTDPAPETFARFAVPVRDLPVTQASAAPDSSDEVSTADDAAEPSADTDGEPAAAASGGAQPSAAPPDAATTAEIDLTRPLASETEDQRQELERVEGIGPRIGAALREAGIHTLRQLADADTATLQGALETAGLRFAPTLPTWSRQARLLADGDDAGFLALTEQLVSRDARGSK